ncbi:MAG: transaldolase, partial [Halofilum sp. (in: g-proteobacteria)]|nr:transaldolase [Halofilum sp. (in: g-proteobacteria)]
CDTLRPVYDATEGADGFVSLEVSPHLAHDTHGTVEQARHLWRSVHRDNLMVKVPATEPGLEAIEVLIAEGINVNVTLLFSVDRYEQVHAAYTRGLGQNERPREVASVASFFVSRVDGMIDPKLDALEEDTAELRSRAAIANARTAYQSFLRLRQEPDFTAQARRGARVQRPLWASTSTKDPSLPDTWYVDNLIGPDTVNTVPPKTLDAWVEHGAAYETLTDDPDQDRAVLLALGDRGIDLKAVTDHLEADGVQKFKDSHDALVEALHAKLTEVSARYASSL